MTFIREVATSVAAAKQNIEDIAGIVQQLKDKAEQAQHQLSLALAGAEQIGSYAQQTGIEDDLSAAEVLINEINESAEYVSVVGDFENKAEEVEGTSMKLEALMGLIESMGGTPE